MKWLALVAVMLLALPAAADMFPDASNAKLPNARVELGVAPQVSAEKFGMKGDGVSTTGITTTAGSATFGGLSLTAADVGKLIWVPGAGAGGSPLITTIASPTTFATPATNAVPATWYSSGTCDPVTRGTGYAPGDTITVAGGTGTVPTQCTVHYTTSVTATVVNGGSGGLAADGTPNGPCRVRATSWAGPPLATQASAMGHYSGTLVGGVLTGPLTIDPHGGGYTNVNPPNLAAEPVVTSGLNCTALTGATVSLTMGVLYARLTTNGVYTTAPADPVAQASSSGGGTGASFNLAYTKSGAVMYGSDNYGASASEGLRGVFAQTGNPQTNIPSGTYLTSSCAPLTAASSVSLVGEGRTNTTIMLPPECIFTATYWAWSTAAGGRPILRDFTLDLNHSIRRVRGLGAGIGVIRFNSVPSTVDSIAIRNAGPQQYAVFIGGTTNSTIVQNIRYDALPDSDVGNCIGSSDGANQTPETPSPMQNLRVVNNTCDGGGLQVDGDHAFVMGNEIFNFKGGSGLFPVPDSQKHMYINNIVRDGDQSFDVNGTTSEGIELHGYDMMVIGNVFKNLGGPGVVTFGRRALIANNKCENVSRMHSSLGAPFSSPVTDHTTNSCIRVITNFASGTVTGNYSTATGGQQYGYIEDPVPVPSAVPMNVFNNNFAGIVAPTKITSIKTVATNTTAPNYAFSEAPVTGIGSHLSSPSLSDTGVAVGAMRSYLAAPQLKSDFTGTVTSLYGYDFVPFNASTALPGSIIGYSSGGAGTGNGATSGAFGNYAFLANAPTAAAGAGATLLNVGLRSNLGSGSSATTTNRGIWISGNGGALSTNYAIYSDSTARSLFAGPMTMTGLPTSAGAGGLTLCVDTAGVIYKKATCP